ncbi:MAG: DPP IV N-terminal domain-containing protein [Gemmatimonadota bacterium]
MSMTRLVTGSLLVLTTSSAVAQLSRDSVYRRLRDFPSRVKGGSIEAHWMADGRSFWYRDGAPAQTTFNRVDPATGAAAPLFDTGRVRSGLAKILGHEPPYQGLPFDTFDFVDGEKAIRFSLEGQAFRLELADYRISRDGTPVAKPPAAPPALGGPQELPAPRGSWTALLQGSDLALRSADDGRTVPLTSDGVERFPWILTGAAWSPGGDHLLALKEDRRQIHFIPVVHWLKSNHEEITYSPYAATGEAVERAELFVIDVRSGRRVAIEVGDDAEQSIRPLGWRAGGTEVLFLRADRLFKQVDLMAASAATGKSRVILAERQPTFVEGLAFSPATLYYPIADGSRFIWRSERDGWSHLYLYDGNGTLVRRLTTGEAPVEAVAAIDEKGGWVYYIAHGDRDRPYDEAVYRVDLEGKRAGKLTDGTGVHAPAFSPDKSVFLDTHSSVDRPPEVVLRRSDGTLVRSLAKADISELEAVHWRAPEEFRVKAADGTTDLYGVLYKPFDFDASKSYPVVDLQYMGNFTHSAPHRFAGTWLGDDAQSLTQLGFVVYIVDARGTTGRGKAFQDFTVGNVGKIEVPDHVATLRQLAKTRPFMDTTRVGITGYSWGGYFTLRAMLTAPEVFSVGVSGAPVVDFMAATSPIEPYMGLPQANPGDYDQGSNLPLAGRLEGKLLMTIGTSDVNVTFNHTMRMVNAFIKAGKFFDLIVLPEETHGLTPAALAYYNEARNRYLVEHLITHPLRGRAGGAGLSP